MPESYLKRHGLRSPNYDKRPFIPVSGHSAHVGWEAVCKRLADELSWRRTESTILAIECYCGVFENEIESALSNFLRPNMILRSSLAMRDGKAIDALVAPDLGDDDPIFGRMTRLVLEDFFDPDRSQIIRIRASEAKGLVVVLGIGATLCCKPDLLVYADMPRWEGQLRQRRNEVSNLGVENASLKASLQYKRSFFIDWRVCDKLKKSTMDRWDFVLDTCEPGNPKMISGRAYHDGLHEATRRPFRVVPFFDPGPWGGQWMREICDLPEGPPNYAWCFDCVPEENSLLLGFAGILVEIPAINLVFRHPDELLGEAVHGRFGAEFPIRFDFLDTMGGGNLSFQVHPVVDFAKEHFGISYTQDESYYILDAEPDAVVYLGHRDGVCPNELFSGLEAAQRGEQRFNDNRFVARFQAAKHDHFLIPAGTLHCSGAGSMVLEISATPYIFTFKLWDWDRLGLDGLPRPVNLDRGRAVIRWARNESYARNHLVNQFTEIARGECWREEQTGLHPAEFIETRRHWFTGKTPHHTQGVVNVLNLVQGSEALVESPTNAFSPFVVHYAETFIIPACVGSYTVRPHGVTEGMEFCTLKAYVRCSA